MRRKADPVDVAFDHWRALDTDGQQRFADQQRGYLGAMGVMDAVTTSRTMPVRSRLRKAKPDVIEEMRLQHGKNCMKRRHGKSEYLHDADFDGPYDVDGVDYCGRCHEALPKVNIPKTA